MTKVCSILNYIVSINLSRKAQISQNFSSNNDNPNNLSKKMAPIKFKISKCQQRVILLHSGLLKILIEINNTLVKCIQSSQFVEDLHVHYLIWLSQDDGHVQLFKCLECVGSSTSYKGHRKELDIICAPEEGVPSLKGKERRQINVIGVDGGLEIKEKRKENGKQ